MNPVLLQTNITFNLPSGPSTSGAAQPAPPAPTNVRKNTVFNDSTDDSSSDEEEEEEDQAAVDARNE